MEAMSIDMEPSAAPANSATSIGSNEQCARINENGVLDGDEDVEDAVEADITAEGIPSYSDGAGGIFGFQYEVLYDERLFTLAGANTNLLLGANPGSSVFDVSETVPDVDGNGVWTAAALDVSETVPEGGSGVIQRLIFATDEGVAGGQSVLGFRTDASVHLDATGAAFVPDLFRFANIAVNQACGPLITPAPTPRPSPTRVPTATPVPTPTPPPTSSPTPTPCCQPPLTWAPGTTFAPTPTACAGPCPQNPQAPPPVFFPGGALCFEQPSPAECDGDPAPGANSDLRTKFCQGSGHDCSMSDSFREATVDGLVFFSPEAFARHSAPLGAIGGQFEATLNLGLLNGPCDKKIVVDFTLLNASTNVSETTSPRAAGQANVMAPLAQDADGNGLPDGIDRYPLFLRNHFDPDWDPGPDGVPDTGDDILGPEHPAQPVLRLGGFTKLQGNWFSLQLLTFAPGTMLPFADEFVAFKPELGYPTVVVIMDPTAPGSPLPISDICTPFDYNFTTFGRSWDNPCTGGPDAAETRGNCPPEFDLAIQEAGYPLLPCAPNNSVDEDLDGVVNDGCPQVNLDPETGSQCDTPISDDGEDSTVNDGCPQVGDISEGGYIGGTCSGLDEGGCVLRSNPEAEGSYYFFTLAASARDADGDGWDNVIDVCVLEPNPNWNPNGFDPVNDPDNDGLPNECDPDANAPSPMSPLQGENSCFDTGIVGPDEDGDCYANRQDNCPLFLNRLQLDGDKDAIGDACDPDAGVPNGQRAILCMMLEAQVEAGAPGTASGPMYNPDPNCATGGAVVDDGAPAPGGPAPTDGPVTDDAGEVTPTPTTSELGATASPAPQTAGGAGGPAAGAVTPTPTVLAAAALPSAGGDAGGSSWLVVPMSIAAALILLGTGVLVRRRLARAIVRNK
jgi:hypothetical protein